MKKFIISDPWKVIEKGLQPHFNLVSESLFSIGNGYMGLRGNFEESYSGDSLQGTYIGGLYYPDKTRVGWWKNGYPEYFAKVLNSCNWIGIHVKINNIEVDLNKADIMEYQCELDMKKGVLSRAMTLDLGQNLIIQIASERFCSMTEKELGLIKYSVKVLKGKVEVILEPYLDFDVRNSDANYDENFWSRIGEESKGKYPHVMAKTKKTEYAVCVAMSNTFYLNDKRISTNPAREEKEKYVAEAYETTLSIGDTLCLEKMIAVTHSNYLDEASLIKVGEQKLEFATKLGYDEIKNLHQSWWKKQWQKCDIVIDGDLDAQQGIRFNIFQMFQTYSGDNPSLNIGPKGFTGEKYGGSTYWDTEAYCLPFYLGTADSSVARNLLIYRYQHLSKAIENASKLGFTNGAALYPMVTMNGEESHNEWEITFEEIHRNGAIAYAIFDYIRYTDDQAYMIEYGLEVLIAISRFWAQRFTWSEAKESFVMLGVTGPNEYENNVNNNWYTNYIARWCVIYTKEQIEAIQLADTTQWERIHNKTHFDLIELNQWKDIIENTYFPVDNQKGIILQQDGFLDKEIKPTSTLQEDDRPIHQNWSWDRILRSCYIKQADVLQGLYFFEEDFDLETIRRNFDYYEPLTVHESSLSPCVHSILASRLNKDDKAYDMYLRTARLDLDDYNDDTKDGCHITSMAGTWMSVVKGFGGMRTRQNEIHFTPHIPDQWTQYSFKINYRNNILELTINNNHVTIINHGESSLHVNIYNKKYFLSKLNPEIISYAG